MGRTVYKAYKGLEDDLRLLCNNHAEVYNDRLDMKEQQAQLISQLSNMQQQEVQQQTELGSWELQQGRAQGWSMRLVLSTSDLQRELDSAAAAALSLMQQKYNKARMRCACRRLKAHWSTCAPFFITLASLHLHRICYASLTELHSCIANQPILITSTAALHIHLQTSMSKNDFQCNRASCLAIANPASVILNEAQVQQGQANQQGQPLCSYKYTHLETSSVVQL